MRFINGSFCFSIIVFFIFAGIAFLRDQQFSPSVSVTAPGRVVIAAPVLLFLYGGDRFLAADLEVMRLAATGMQEGRADIDYLVRAHRVVAQLNACHEDNYYLANGLLTWGGAFGEGNGVLHAAVQCREWDFVPAFFYGINSAFFDGDIDEARRFLELGALRSPDNSAGLRKLAIMLRVEKFVDENVALSYLTEQRDSTSDPKLRLMLDKRVSRLEGLVVLRQAQRRFEAEGGELVRLEQLVDKGLIANLPVDPLGLGYQLIDGKIMLKEMRVAGFEVRP